MPGAVRAETDVHVGHDSPTPSPKHQTAYVAGQTTVHVNGKPVIRKDDKTACGDPAVGSASSVYAEGKLIHRLNDATGGHGSFVPNKAQTASSDVIIEAGWYVPITVSPEEAKILNEEAPLRTDADEAIEYGDGGISNGDGEFRSNNTSAVNGVTGPQQTEEDSASTFEKAAHPTLNFLSHTDPRIKESLRNKLVRIAEEFGDTLTITSAYRDPAYNTKVGGAKKSQHMLGNAVDVVMSSYNTSERQRFIEIAINQGITGIGVYNTFTHIDIGGKRAWGSSGSRRSLPKYPWAQTVLKKYGYATS